MVTSLISSKVDAHPSAFDQDIGRADVVVSLADIVKSYGPTIANAGISISMRRGDILGLVGGNGAGKSTLMKILCGEVRPDQGTLTLAGEAVASEAYMSSEAHRRGIRMVHQELSLCANLSVAENFFLERPADAHSRPGWRNSYRTQATEALEQVFPGTGIDVDREVTHLTIAERQMVEIARATSDPKVKIIVLDEPTSSLDLERSRQLRAYIRRRSATGVAFIFISHKLQEILDVATRILVLRNGAVAWQGNAIDSSIVALIRLMGGNIDAIRAHGREQHTSAQSPLARIGGRYTRRLGHDIELRPGEIVGLAGLEGSGQKDLLQALFAGNRASDDVVRKVDASFIAGDRQREGVFALWSVLANISIGRIARRFPLAFISDPAEREVALEPAAALGLSEDRFESNILELSGGNQQKALVARALVSEASLILLDDPTRGVDIATKQDFYRICDDLAAKGRTLVWLSTEDAELLIADRVLVFSNDEIVCELVDSAITEEAIVEASFAGGPDKRREAIAVSGRTRLGQPMVQTAPFVSLALVFLVMALINPAVASVFGLDLLLMPAVSLVLVAMAQMFVVGGSEIDLGVGAFTGLISVLSATWLYDSPALGATAIVGALAAYAILGALIQVRRIPAIVVTLGGSFIWLGIGYSIQPTPGGTSPEWLSALFGWSVGFLPTSILLIVGIGLVSRLIDRTPFGVAMRGFGANALAMRRSGWKPVPYAFLRYLLSGVFAAIAGLSLTAINTASDINSGNSYTLLSVAAVVMGGSSLIGGRISPAGVAAGAITLSLLGALLGVLDVSSDYNAAVQGLVLILLLSFRSLVTDRRSEA